jgi:hypothetical protein
MKKDSKRLNTLKPFATMGSMPMTIVAFELGHWKKIISPDYAGFVSVYKAHPPVHIRICAGGCNAVDGPKDKQGGGIIFFQRP